MDEDDDDDANGGGEEDKKKASGSFAIVGFLNAWIYWRIKNPRLGQHCGGFLLFQPKGHELFFFWGVEHWHTNLT